MEDGLQVGTQSLEIEAELRMEESLRFVAEFETFL